MKNIRNFSIIAHIDHGKSTLSDRLIQLCGGLSKREMTNQVLDSMDLERERGITIKARNATLYYKASDGNDYQLNFIDTPGHVDFYYEVSRSLSACEGALLVVDTTKGVEAQTIANYSTAVERNLKIIPILNKIDLPTSDPNRVAWEIQNLIGIHPNNMVCCSAKTGDGITQVLQRLIAEIPAPTGDPNAPLQALIIDSWFDNYLGLISLIRIKNGTLKKGDKIQVMTSGKIYHVEKLGIFTPKKIYREILHCGEVGWLICNIKDIHGAPVGDTITRIDYPAKQALPCVKKMKPQVYASVFPYNVHDYTLFRNALVKLSINDTSLFFEPESSSILGCGFRCGFLGLLHMEIIQERLEREYHIPIITTFPTVMYEILTTYKQIVYVDTPFKLPHLRNILEFREPIAECHILCPKIYLGDIINLCIKKRGIQKSIMYHEQQVELIYDIPIVELIFNFFNLLKSHSHGYATLHYTFKYFKYSDMVRMDILINGKIIEEMSTIMHRCNALKFSQERVNKLKTLLYRKQYNITIQAMVNNKIIARSNIQPFRKNVLERCSGGDVTRKHKLLNKQKKGKKRMKQIGFVSIPKELFRTIFSINNTTK